MDAANRRRYERLGFEPQRENVYNKLLPYADQLDEESTELFANIKTNLVKSVLAREMRPGCALWTSRLNKYMKIYGMKFSKTDHILLIRLYYHMFTTPDLEPTRMNKCATTLTQLLKKRYLISRDELELEWRPLYEVVRSMNKSKSDIGMYRCLSNLSGAILNVIRLARIYFPARATQEIWDEFRPQLCPLSPPTITSAIEYLEVFLPVCVKPEEAPISFNLWFEELMTLWNSCYNANVWEDQMLWLMCRLSSFTMGQIDWEPYIPLMFVRFSRSFQLPIAYKKKQSGKHHKLEISAIAIWITCNLNGDKNSTFFHLEKFMQQLESYFYPANFGRRCLKQKNLITLNRYTTKLRKLLRKLAYYFVQRVHFERFRKPSWEHTNPDHFLLTDDDIDRFVKILKPCLEHGMFLRIGGQEIGLALQYLGSLRPNLIIPMTLDKLYASMDSLTEPHKLTASMMGVTAVARYMVQGSRGDYPEGATHVMPLLMALLPGIDPNDIRKCLVTFNFMVNFINMVPLINSAEASLHHQLTEEEHAVCEASAGFEDFVLQFFDRLCSWVDSNSLDFVRMEQVTNSSSTKNRAEVIAESALFSVISCVLHQCSPEIFTAALRKVFNFATSKIMEIQISGKMIAIICQGFAKVNPKETLKLFIPHLCGTIEQHLQENPNIGKEEHLDAELLYNLQILSEICDARSELLIYSARLTSILDQTLHLTSLSGNQMASHLLEMMLTSLTCILPIEYRSSSTPYSTKLADFLSVREWGQAANIDDLKLDWYTPGSEEIALVQSLLHKYLGPELDKLDKYASGELSLSREELRRALRIVTATLAAHPAFPAWDEPALQLVDSILPAWAFSLRVGNARCVSLPDGGNVPQTIAASVHRVQRRLLAADEGDTKSIQCIVQIYNVLLFNKSRSQDFEYHWKNFHILKKLFEDRLHQNKLHLRHILINRVLLQHEFRIESRSCSFTRTHRQILLDLFELSVSRYSEVRIAAQAKLFAVVAYFPYSYTVLEPRIIEILQLDSELHHETFKGCLYVLTSPKNSPIVARHDWAFVRRLWPLIVRSKPSEKPSIVNLVNNVLESVNRFFPTIAIRLVFSDEAIKMAALLAESVPRCELDDFRAVIENGGGSLESRCVKRKLDYEATVDGLLDACVNGNLHWRYHSIAIAFLKVLVHNDVKYNANVIRYFLHALIDESITIRKTALRVVLFILIQNKPKFVKVEVDPVRLSNSTTFTNDWLLYNSKTLPKSTAEWNVTRFSHSSSTGFATWPKRLELYAPYDRQPNVTVRVQSEAEQLIYEFFTNASNLELFIKYFSMEERKGKDQFNAYKFLLFKNLFKIFEAKLLGPLLAHLERLADDRSESSQRCAAELISGLIRGSKHWNFDETNALWSSLLPILDRAIVSMCSETMTDWGLSIAMALDGRDPHRAHWLLEHLLRDPLADATSFVACARLHLLHTALNQQPWRNGELFDRLFAYLRAHLSHPFQNIRDKVSSCLTMVFARDLDRASGRVRLFFDELRPSLERLYAHALRNAESNGGGEVGERLGALSLMDDERERERVVRLFKVVAKYATSSIVRTNCSHLVDFLDLVPLCCVLQANEADDEIEPICTNLLAVLAGSAFSKDNMVFALRALRTAAGCQSWSARAAVGEFIGVFVFHNMATIVSRAEWVRLVEEVVLGLLEDVKPEVRVIASQVLSGLLHCQFIGDTEQLLGVLKGKARTVLKRKNNEQNLVANTLRIRHAGVLGLCSFISSHPYDVPDFLPDVFGALGPHLNDPQPIPATIRKTLGDFKRTHHENWELHKLKFTEEELIVISDLTVPPSYYA